MAEIAVKWVSEILNELSSTNTIDVNSLSTRLICLKDMFQLSTPSLIHSPNYVSPPPMPIYSMPAHAPKLSQVSPSQLSSSLSEEERMRRRSIVVLHCPESLDASPQGEIDHTFAVVSSILNHVGAACRPRDCYRMGTRLPGKKRPIKVVLPTSGFAKHAINNAKNLLHFPGSRIYIRPSLTEAERAAHNAAYKASRQQRVINRTPANLSPSTQTAVPSDSNIENDARQALRSSSTASIFSQISVANSIQPPASVLKSQIPVPTGKRGVIGTSKSQTLN